MIFNTARNWAWPREHFISTGLIDETVVRKEVADSWQRCRACGIDPRQYHSVGELDENVKASRLSGQADLVRASRPFLDSLFRIMKSLKIIILLLDEECVILDSIGEGPGWKDSVKQKAVPGYSFHEKFSGTTAAGIAMNTGKPCQLLPEEHYCPFEIELICSAAPIHDTAQNLTGVLYVTAISDVAVKNPHIFGMVTAAAKAIEYNLSMMKETEKVVLANKFLKAAMAQISKGMMIFDSAGKLVNINMPAATMFGFVENEVVGKDVDHILPDPSLRELMAPGRKNTFKEVILSGNKRHNRYYASANNIFDDSMNCVGKALLFEQINNVKPLVHRMMGCGGGISVFRYHR